MNDYPAAWKDGTLQVCIRERANHQCEHCGMKFTKGTNLAITETNSNGAPCIGTVHHINGFKSDCTYENLVYVCQACHLHIQAVWQPGGFLPLRWNGVPEWIIARNLAYKVTEQLRLF